LTSVKDLLISIKAYLTSVKAYLTTVKGNLTFVKENLTTVKMSGYVDNDYVKALYEENIGSCRMRTVRK